MGNRIAFMTSVWCSEEKSPPEALILECLVSSWYSCLGRTRKCGLVGVGKSVMAVGESP